MMKGNVFEYVKNCVMLLLFVCMLILAASYIIQTQRLTMAAPSDISRDSLLVLKTGHNINVKYNQKLLYPAFIGYKTKSTPPKGCNTNEMIDAIYPELTKYIVDMLGSGSECVMVMEDNGDYWNECLKSEMYVYIKYHTEIPNVMLYAYLTDDYLIDGSKVASGDMTNIKEILFILEYVDAYTYEYDMVVRNENGSIARYDNIAGTDEANKFSLDMFGNTAGSVKVYFNYEFAGNTDLSYENITLEASTIIYTSDMAVREIKTDTSIDVTAIDNGIIEMFNFNPARTDLSYKEDGGKTNVYVDTQGILKINADGNINYRYTESDVIEENFIYIYDYLSYNKNNSDYTIYETILAVNNFIDSFQTESNVVFGKIYAQDSEVVLEYYYCFNNILLVDENYEPLTAYKFTVSENYFKEISINYMNITQLGRKINLKTEMALTVYDMTVEEKLTANVELAYITGEPDTSYLPEYVMRLQNELG
jgi:hypothetical protein